MGNFVGVIGAIMALGLFVIAPFVMFAILTWLGVGYHG
jgi:hypothetical protein